MNLDFSTLAACLIALGARERECEARGLSAEHWAKAKRRVQSEIASATLTELQGPTVGALLRKQAG